jgi:hypothetical protein
VPDSNVLEILSGRGSLYEIINAKTLLRRLDALLNECIWNARVSKYIDSLVKSNEGLDFNDKKWVTSRLRSSALELLLTEGYLEENKQFYHKMRAAFNTVIAMNEMIGSWYIQDQRVEKWFRITSEKHSNYFGEAEKAISQARDKISEKFSYILT